MKTKNRLFEVFEKVNKIKLTHINENEEEKKSYTDDEVKNLVKQKDETGDVVKGGLGKDSTSKDFDFEQLKRGLKVELEHSDDPLIALDIAFDHLMEDPKYYGEEEDDAEEMSMKNAQKDVNEK